MRLPLDLKTAAYKSDARNSMLDYVYVPATQPMDIEHWPTLAEMIISNKRVVVMLAYDANQKSVRPDTSSCASPVFMGAQSTDADDIDPMATGHLVLPMANAFLAH